MLESRRLVADGLNIPNHKLGLISMRLWIREVLLGLFALGKDLYPERTPWNFWRRARFLGIGIAWSRKISSLRRSADNPGLAALLKRHPDMLVPILETPYINAFWSRSKVFQTLDQHYRLASQRIPFLLAAAEQEVDLRIALEEYPDLRLVLSKDPWLKREGEVALKLLLNDRFLYAVAFTLGIDQEGSVAYVGAMQGSMEERSLEIYRDITHKLNGMRPRDLMLEALKLICAEAKVTRIHAISNAQRHHLHPYFGKIGIDKVKQSNYDEIWNEHDGILLGNGFYNIPITVRRREPGDIPPRKRATYRRRYQMLDKLALDIHRSSTLYAASPVRVNSH